jgi:DNA-binding MarR family transcriptional regulator
MAKKRKSASLSGNSMRGHKAQQRFDLSIYPMFYMGQILHKNAENMATTLNGYRLHNSEWRILAALQYHGEMSVGELSALTTLERSFVGRLVGKLDRAGLIERANSASDRRYTKVSLTRKGQNTFFDRLLPVVKNQMNLLLRGISNADRRRLIRNLDRMMKNAHAVAGSVAPLGNAGPKEPQGLGASSPR